LTRREETALVGRIRAAGQRFRRRLLAHPYILHAAGSLLEDVCNNNIRMDRVIAVTLANPRAMSRIRRILVPNLRTLRDLLERDRIDFAVAMDNSRSQSCRREAWRRCIRNRHKAAQLVEEVKLRTKCLLPMLNKLRELSARMEKLNLQLRENGNGSTKNSPAGGLHTLQHELVQITLEGPATLRRRIARTLRMKQEHDEARQLLAQANLRLVVSVAWSYRHGGLDLPDLIQAGNVGLMQAVDGYDCTRGCKFSTYATWWIRQAIMKGLTDQGGVVRVPPHMVDRIRRVRRFTQELAHELGRPPRIDETADAAGMTVAYAEFATTMMNKSCSIERPVDNNGERRLADVLQTNGSHEPGHEQARKSLLSCIGNALRTLSYREQEILQLRYGLRDGCSYTLMEVGKMLALSRERVRQIEDLALRKLRRHSCTPSLAEFVERPIPVPLVPVRRLSRAS